MKIKWMALMIMGACCCGLPAETVKVGPDEPVKTLEEAVELARTGNHREIRLAAGKYYLKETLVLTPGDNGLRIVGESPDNTVISGGVLLKNLKFTPYRDGIMQADCAVDFPMDQLFVNGRRLDMARFPNREAGKGKNVFDVWSLSENRNYRSEKDALHSNRGKNWKNPTTGYIHAMHERLWGDMHWKIVSADSQGRIKAEGGYQNNRPTGWHRVFRFVENIFEELDAPGEWFYDREAKKLYIYPPDGVDLNTAEIESVRLTHLIKLKGESVENPVRGIVLSNFRFTHAARTFMENRERLLRSDWTLYRGAALDFSFSRDCTIQNCDFVNLGGNAVIFDGYNENDAVKESLFTEIGANGIVFAGRIDSIRYPLFNYADVPDYANMSREKGPKSRNYPRNCTVENCLITRTGRDEKQTAPVQISMSHRITVRDCSIYDVPRAGINISENSFGGHLIERCDIFNTVLETGDHGSFNSWGRDRYWQPDLRKMSDVVVQNPELPYLDILDTTVLRSSRWRCDHGWDIDLDDGSTDYLIENNLLLNGGLKLREGYRRTVRNNLIINNSLHPHCWLKNSGDVIVGNVFYAAARTAGTMQDWGKEVNRNLYTRSQADLNAFRNRGWDADSILLAPQYKDPEHGDYTITNLPANSPFKNLPMDIYGVKCPRLKQVAKQPEFSEPGRFYQATAQEPASRSVVWGGMTLKKFDGKNEHSAYGVTPDTVGYVVERNAIAPLKNGDLIVAVKGKPFTHSSMLAGYGEAFTTSPSGNSGNAAGHVTLSTDRITRVDTGVNKWFSRYTKPLSWQQQYTEPVMFDSYTFTSANDCPERDPKSWTLEGSMDGKEWTQLSEEKDVVFEERYQEKEFRIARPGSYRYYRITFTECARPVGAFQIAEIAFRKTGAEKELPVTVIRNQEKILLRIPAM